MKTVTIMFFDDLGNLSGAAIRLRDLVSTPSWFGVVNHTKPYSTKGVLQSHLEEHPPKSSQYPLFVMQDDIGAFSCTQSVKAAIKFLPARL